MDHLIPGQRFISQSEPELGLGVMLAAAEGRITLLFQSAGETRLYAIRNAPLRRFLLREGDAATDADGREFVVRTVRIESGLALYGDGTLEIPETRLSDRLAEKSAARRLLAGDVDESAIFSLRHEALMTQSDLLSSPLRGFLGARVDLIPHQLHIAREVSSRQSPRVLLADEVGLGKTMEACLIMHRLMLTGQASRVLILTPDSLAHQWFVELYRKFNLWAAIYDAARCEALLQNDPAGNPFDDAPLVLCPMGLFRGARPWRELATKSQWDLVIVDEAHHLGWTATGPSEEYRFVEGLSKNSKGVILLTATPEQLGEEGHHARLRLLDPARFQGFESFKAQKAGMKPIAKLAEKVRQRFPLSARELSEISRLCDMGKEALAKLAAEGEESAELREAILDQLIDRHGPSRVIFRNSRASMAGFPARERHVATLRRGSLEALREEFRSDLDSTLPMPTYVYLNDPRLSWLLGLIRELAGKKLLVICRYREKVEALETALRGRINLKIAQFHEGLTLVQRDRNAAWFSEVGGADLLLCSEIGSEGRNFQFASHMVFWDVPINPELVEQRIGRLDRIGQTETIHIHVPVIQGSPQEAAVVWLDQGLDLFRANYGLGAELHERFAPEVAAAAVIEGGQSGARAARLKTLVSATRREARALAKALEAGRDRLLEIGSCRARLAEQMIQDIRSYERRPRLKAFLGSLCDHLGVRFEDLGEDRLRLGGGDLVKDRLPGLPEHGMTATTSRELARSREDLVFLTWDHPVVTALLDSLLTSPQGNAAFAIWHEAPARGCLVEAIHVVELQAPANLWLDRFLPPTPIRVVMDTSLRDLSAECLKSEFWSKVEGVDPLRIAPHADAISAQLPRLLAACERLSATRMETITQEAIGAAQRFYSAEISRMDRLARLNPLVDPREAALLRKRLKETLAALSQPTLRLDAVRMIIAQPGAAGSRFGP